MTRLKFYWIKLTVASSWIFLSCFGAASTAQAFSVHFYRLAQANKGPNWGLMETYITTQGQAYLMMDYLLGEQGKPRLFCVPKDFDQSTAHLVKLVDLEIAMQKAGTNEDAVEIDPLLLLSLMTSLPVCRREVRRSMMSTLPGSIQIFVC